ncbi:MAG: response regulator [Chitinispirillaceae bacterium]|nr:response regulator [Chitinispirillaceae bacterium]
MDVSAAQVRFAAIWRLLLDLEKAFQKLPPVTSVFHEQDPDPRTLLKTLTEELRQLSGTLSDVSFSKKGNIGSLSDNDEVLGITLRSIADAVITVDPEGRILLMNKAAELLTGYTLREAEGKPLVQILVLFDEVDHATPLVNYCERTVTGDDPEGERRALLRSRDNRERMVSLKGMPVSEKGQNLGTVLVLRDISKSYFLEEEVLKIRKLESVGVLAGGIAHDFNNLLTGITTNLFMARMSAVGNNEACSLISEAEKAAFKATTLTKQLLSFARGGPSIKELASIKQLIQDTVGFCLSGSNVDYRLDLPDDLSMVEIDKGQIDQVLNNLIMNAAQAMPQGGTVTISARNIEMNEKKSSQALPFKSGKYVRVAIKDEGVGIPHEHLERIFDPYFTTRDEGSGLGLSTAYSVIKRHGGHIYVESSRGNGSTFIFFLPVPEERDTKEKKTDTFMFKGIGKVLIMDDDMIVRTVVETLLKKAGYSPVCASNGEQALSIYNEALSAGDPFMVTIMDLTIPGGMGGKETVKRLREIDNNARVIVFSGYSNDPIFSNYREFGFDGVLSKPFSIEEFMKTILTVLGKKQG